MHLRHPFIISRWPHTAACTFTSHRNVLVGTEQRSRAEPSRGRTMVKVSRVSFLGHIDPRTCRLNCTTGTRPCALLAPMIRRTASIETVCADFDGLRVCATPSSRRCVGRSLSSTTGQGISGRSAMPSSRWVCVLICRCVSLRFAFHALPVPSGVPEQESHACLADRPGISGGM